jgi:hypothetical protein
MLILHCPNCQHDNRPGDRYCASCGMALNLRACPNCGKFDGVKAIVCTGCGTRLPPVATEATAAAADDLEGDVATTPTLAPGYSMRPLPLIVVALVAGGLPLLWMYRESIPVPKVWQAKMQAASEPVPAAPATDATAAAKPPKDCAGSNVSAADACARQSPESRPAPRR